MTSRYFPSPSPNPPPNPSKPTSAGGGAGGHHGAYQGQGQQDEGELRESIEHASKYVESFLHRDLQSPSLFMSLLGRDAARYKAVSGLVEGDYPSLAERGIMPQKLYSIEHQASIPVEIKEILNRATPGSCHMGLFPEIYRTWMTLDTELFLWDFRDGGDISFYDGCREPILSVGLVPVKSNIYRPTIRYLLCLTTPLQIIVLGFMISDSDPSEMMISSPPLFVLPSSGNNSSIIAGCINGRIFMGGINGAIEEICYSADRGWGFGFRDNCYKKTLTTSYCSYIWPSFLASTSDPLKEMVVDNVRMILFTLSTAGELQAFDLGEDGLSFSRVGSVSYQVIVNSVLSMSNQTLESSVMAPIVGISAIEEGELNLVAVMNNGVRLYFTCIERPQSGVPVGYRIPPTTLNLAHIRVPPGYTGIGAYRKPNAVQHSFYTNGLFTMSCKTSGEADIMWLIAPNIYPSSQCTELTNTHILPGHTLDVKELPSADLELRQMNFPDVVIQHLTWQRQVVVLTDNGTVVFRISKPYEALRDLMIERGGPDSIRPHFEYCCSYIEHPLANAVLLATHPFLFVDNNMQEWAAKLLVMFGGLEFPQERAGSRTGYPQELFRERYSNGHNYNSPGVTPSPRDQFNPQRGSPGNVSYISPGSPAMSSTFRQEPSPSPSISPRPPLFFQTPNTGQPNQDGPSGVMSGSGQPAQQYWPYSVRHDALYMCVGRILFPIWTKNLVISKLELPIVPNLTGDEVSYAIAFLRSIHKFISQSPALYSSSSFQTRRSHASNVHTPLRPPPSGPVLDHEKASLLALKNFVGLAMEVLGMWKILCDHQFSVMIEGLDDKMHKTTIKELIVSGQGTVTLILNALINKYLGDNAAVDAISCRLREVCPTLFKNEDAIGSKVAEILSRARTTTDPNEKESLLRDSVVLCEQICTHGRLNIRGFCQQFGELGYAVGSVRLCLAAARAADPNLFGLMVLKSSGVCSDPIAVHAYQTRLEIYKIVFEILDLYLSKSSGRPSPISMGTGTRIPEERIPIDVAKQYVDDTITSIIRSKDECFHITLYNWLLERKLFDKLLELKHEYLDGFLQRAAESVVSGNWSIDGVQGNDTRVLDLLWRHHEMNQNHMAASHILSKLADSTTTGLNLQQRVEYLARAVICAKSVGRYGDVLETLEDKLEVAQIQKNILNSIISRISVVSAVQSGDDSLALELKALQDAVPRLNSQLFNITVLYADFAVPFKLHEATLEIFHSAGHSDPDLIENLWAEIVDTEVASCSHQGLESQMEVIKLKLITLGRKYISTSAYFPIDYLVEHLEAMKPSEHVDPGWVFKTMLEIGLPFSNLLGVYESLWRRLVRKSTPGGELDMQIAKVIMKLIRMFVDGEVQLSSRISERNELVEKCKGLVASMIVEFSSRFDQESRDIVHLLNAVKARLDRE